MKFHLFIASMFVVAALMTACMKSDSIIKERFEGRVAQIQKELAPDLSLNVFRFNLTQEENIWKINGESTVQNAEKAVLALADSLFGKGNYQTDIHLLPAKELGDSTYGIVKVSTANLRRTPAHSAELVDQNIMGNVVRLLKRQGMWYLVQTEYQYIGWMTRYSLQRTDQAGLEQWQNAPQVKVKALWGLVHTKADERSTPLCDVVLNVPLIFLESGSRWFKVQLPDGNQGYILRDLVDRPSLKKSTSISATDILATAQSMMGIPYLWGGNSTKGNDCSGFTQTVFKKHGMQLPRDARQQVLIGEEIVWLEDFSNIQPGDLVFFGINERITHVGISMGGYEFIHQDSRVNIDSFDESASNFNAFRKKTLKSIKRVINNEVIK